MDFHFNILSFCPQLTRTVDVELLKFSYSNSKVPFSEYVYF